MLIQPTLLQVPLNEFANSTLDLLSDYAEKIGMFGLTRDDVVPPVSMLSIAQQVMNDGFSVSIVDMYLEEICGGDPKKLLIERIKKENPLIVGIADMEACTMDAAIYVADTVKDINKNIITVMGGVNATPMDEFLLNNYDNLDVIVKNEGEQTFSELVKKSFNTKSFDDIRGITYRVGEKIKKNPPRPFMQPEEIPIPNREIYSLEKLYKVNSKVDMVFGSRGCPYNCSFCNGPSFWKRRWRGRLVEDIIKELKTIEEAGAKRFHMWDLNFGVNKKWVKRLCDAIQDEGIGLEWEVELRVDDLKEPLIKNLRKAGCNTAFCGIESPDQAILDSVHKSYESSSQERALKTAKKQGLNIEGGYVVGLPEDNERSISATTNQAVKYLESDLVIPLFFIFVPFPGTEIGENPEKFGIKIENKNFQHFHFIPPKPLASTKYLTAEEVFDLWELGQKRIFESVNQKLKI